MDSVSANFDPTKVKGIWLNLETLKDNWLPTKEALESYIKRTAGKIEMDIDPETRLASTYKVGPPPPQVENEDPAIAERIDTSSDGKDKASTAIQSKSTVENEMEEVRQFIKNAIAQQYISSRSKADDTDNINSKDNETDNEQPRYDENGDVVLPPEVTEFIANRLAELERGNLSIIGTGKNNKYFVTNEKEIIKGIRASGDAYDSFEGVETETNATPGDGNASKSLTCDHHKEEKGHHEISIDITCEAPDGGLHCCYCNTAIQSTVLQTELDLKVLEKAIERIEKRESGELVPVTKDLKQALPRSARRKTQFNKTLAVTDSLGMEKPKMEFSDQIIKVYGEGLLRRNIHVTREYALEILQKCDGKIIPAIEDVENTIVTRELAIDRTGRFSRTVEYNLLLDDWDNGGLGIFARDEVLNYLEDEDRELIVFGEDPASSYFYYLITHHFPHRKHRFWMDIFGVEAKYRIERQKTYNLLMKRLDAGEITREMVGQMMDRFDGLAMHNDAKLDIEPHRGTTQKRRLARKKFFNRTLNEHHKETDAKTPPSRAAVQKAVRKLLSEELK